MSNHTILALLSVWVTYYLRFAGAYLFMWLFSRLIASSRVRFLLWGVFVAGMVGTWLWLLFLPTFWTPLAPKITVLAAASSRQLSWPLNPGSISIVAGVFSSAPNVYAVVVGLLLVQFCAGFLQLRSVLRTSMPPPERLSSFFESIRFEVDAAPCELRLASNLRSPAAMGWWRPKVLLPRELLSRLTEVQLADILRHELMHVRRRDYLWDRLATLACYAVFFHPAVWSARRQMRWERELVCDEGVAGRSTDHRLAYADCLTRIARWWFLEKQTAGAVDLLSSSESLLSVRVRKLLECETTRNSGLAKSVARAGAALLVISGVWLMPGISLVARFSRTPLLQAQQVYGDSQIASHANRKHSLVRRKPLASVRKSSERAEAPNLELPLPSPVIPDSDVEPLPPTEAASIGSNQTSETDLRSQYVDFERDFSASLQPAPFSLPRPHPGDVLDTDSRHSGSIWDESSPQIPRRAASKIGTIAGRAITLGIGVLGGRTGDRDRDRDH